MSGELAPGEAPQSFAALVASLGHDLRSPLNAILGYAQLMIEEGADGAGSSAVEDLRRILAAGQLQLAHLGALLELARHEAGLATDGGGPADAAEVLAEVSAAGRREGVDVDAGGVDGPVLLAAGRETATAVLRAWLGFVARRSASRRVSLRLEREASAAVVTLSAPDPPGEGEDVAWAAEPYRMGPRRSDEDWILAGLDLKTRVAAVRRLGGATRVERGPHGLGVTVRLPLAAAGGRDP